ncbi:MAG: hypothetical protein WC679_01080 [Bacteroidales bacterium]|jgi:hypothetical protein
METVTVTVTENEKNIILCAKSKVPIDALIIYYKNNYCDSESVQEIQKSLIGILSCICDRFFPIKNIYSVLKELNPNKYDMYDGLYSFDYNIEVLTMLINQIRFSQLPDGMFNQIKALQS